MIKPPELKFRHFLAPKMQEYWLMTWHEDREISPGVPDLHYVMNSPLGQLSEYRVGWLELKAVDNPLNSRTKISVEPSQHQYIRRWLDKMPMHFLVRVIDRIYIIPAKWSKEIAVARCDYDLSIIAADEFHQSLITERLPAYLREETLI